MFNIQSYLSKFVKLGLENEEAKKTIQKILLENIGKEVSLDKISYNKNIISIKEGAAYKNIIFIKKDLLLSNFNKANLRVVDIR